ncbi:unnamed protein product [Symbiodinium necroappetens]|uniref:Uncharacterized protein n=1 Tax=Symbiodinium necroappetens TaxID=1628268 RepID=A0A813C3G1_9DINO|nr:unnamed protein product [Symbiodinium necroappetens]
MAAAVGQFVLQWLFEATYPLHAEFTEQPQPLRRRELRWQCRHDYAVWGRTVLQCLLAGGVPQHRRLEVRLQLQRAGRLAGVCEEIQMRDILRASWILERPIAPASWCLGALGFVGETEEYLQLVDASIRDRPAGGPELPVDEPVEQPPGLLQATLRMEEMIQAHLEDDDLEVVLVEEYEDE